MSNILAKEEDIFLAGWCLFFIEVISSIKINKYIKLLQWKQKLFEEHLDKFR